MRWLTNNLGLKLLALVFASTLSAYVYYEINYPVPDVLYLDLEAEGLNPDLVLANELPRTVAVAVRGSYRAIRLVRGRGLHATVNLAALKKPGAVRAPVHVPPLGDITITHVDPSDVQIQVDKGQTRRFTIQVERRGSLDKRYLISDEQWSPKTVRITGPDKVLEQIATVRIEPDLNRLNSELDAFAKGTTARLSVNLYDDDHRKISSTALYLEPADIEYSLSVVPSASIHMLKVIPDYIGQPPDDYLLSGVDAIPQYITVPAKDVKGSYTTVRTESIDLKGKTKSFIAKPKLIYPFKVPSGSTLPGEVEVTVEIISLAEEGLRAMRVGVEVKGRSEELDYLVTPPQLKVLSERLSVLGDADRRMIVATVDATGLVPGDYRMVPQLRLPQSLDDARINPNWVNLTVIEKGR